MKPRILVVGDFMLDVDIHYTQTRTAPEGVPVLRETSRESRWGGAGAVAEMCRRLGAEVVLSGVVGREREWHSSVGIIDPSRPTTTKYRHWIDGKLSHRVDDEVTWPVSDDIEKSLADQWTGKFDAVIVADHGKGCISGCVWDRIACRFASIPIFVDPCRERSVGDYPDASVIVMNRVEAGGIQDAEQAEKHATEILVWHNLAACVIKLDCDGYVIATADGVHHEPSMIQAGDVVDTVGAGDQFIAAMTVAYLENGGNWQEAAAFGNLAAAINCTKRGTTPVTRDEIMSVIPNLCQ